MATSGHCLLVLWCSLVLVLAVASALVATEALGPLSFQIDPNSPTYVIISMHPELATEHSGVFLLLAVGLAAAAAFNVLAVNKPLPRLLFAVVFSYCSAKALVSWAFPLNMSEDSASHGTWELPWLYSIASTLLGTSSILHSSLPNTTSSGELFLFFNKLNMLTESAE